MHSHEIKAMVESLVNAAAITNAQRADVEAALAGHWSKQIAVVWQTSDVHHQANTDGFVLTDDAASTILQQALRNHDATVGLTWESFAGSYGDLAAGADCIALPARHKAFCQNGGHVVLEQWGKKLCCRRVHD